MGYLAQLVLKPSQLMVEFFGTYLFVLIGTSAITAVTIAGQPNTPLIILLNTIAFSIPVAALVYYLSRSAAAQFNPAVTLLAALNGKLNVGQATANILMQLLAAILASITIGLMYGSAGVEVGLGAPQPATNMGWIAAFVAEIIGATLFLGIIQLQINRQATPQQAALHIGVGLALALILTTSISGGAINPARALAPQLASSQLNFWWLYAIAPLVPAIIIGLLQKTLGTSSGTNKQAKDKLPAKKEPQPAIAAATQTQETPTSQSSQIEPQPEAQITPEPVMQDAPIENVDPFATESLINNVPPVMAEPNHQQPQSPPQAQALDQNQAPQDDQAEVSQPHKEDEQESTLTDKAQDALQSVSLPLRQAAVNFTKFKDDIAESLTSDAPNEPDAIDDDQPDQNSDPNTAQPTIVNPNPEAIAKVPQAYTSDDDQPHTVKPAKVTFINYDGPPEEANEKR